MISGIVHAQTDFTYYEQKIKAISDLEDEHEKEYQLAEFAKRFSAFLQNNTIQDAVSDSAFIQITKSSDSKYRVFYYNTYKKGKVYRLDWYILYGGVNQKKVLHFFDKEIHHKIKKGTGEIQLHLARLNMGNVNLYPLSFSFVSDMKIYREYRDVATICMFEELLNRPEKEALLALNDSILGRMKVMWNSPEWFLSEFQGIKRMSTLISDDKKVKICTWNIQLPNSLNKFFGAILLKDKTGNIKVNPLIDVTQKIRSPEKAMLTPKKWFGAMYYDDTNKSCRTTCSI
jgi:hypothetical protein